MSHDCQPYLNPGDDLETYLELPVASCHAHCGVVTHYLGGHHGQRFALGRVDFSGHDAGSGLVFRQGELAKSASRTGTKVSDIVGDLHKRHGDDIESTMCFNEGIMCGKCLELSGPVVSAQKQSEGGGDTDLIRGGLELIAGNIGDLCSDLDVKALLSIETLSQ